MATLPPEEELEPTHDLGGEPTDEEAPEPDLEDMDQDPEPGLEGELELEDVAIPDTEDSDVEAELEGGN